MVYITLVSARLCAGKKGSQKSHKPRPDPKRDTFFQFIEMEDYMSQLLGVRVDLVMKSALRPRIGKRVLSEVVPVLALSACSRTI